MKNIYKISIFALSALVLVGCVDLDTAPLGSTVTSEQKEEVVAGDPSKAEASVTAVTSNFTVYGQIYGNDQHNDFGYPAIMMFMDSRGEDFVADNVGYNWFRGSMLFSDCLRTSDVTHMIWGTLYKQIYSANAVAATIDLETDDPTLQFYLAQALAIRAFDYFTLVQLYQFNYVGNENALGVPIITEKNADIVAAEGCARSTVKETYDQIYEDINNAIDLLEKSSMKRADKRYVSLDVAYGIRARVNLVTQNWAAALSDATTAISKSSSAPYSLADASKPGFIDIEDRAWMWGVLITDKDRVSTTGICNFPSHMGSLNYGYASVGAWRWINKKLFATIPETDVRRGWFLDGDGISANLSESFQTYVTEKKIPAYTQVKYAPKGNILNNSENDNDIPLMRIEEMYLIKAEAEAMSGNTAGAITSLESFVQTYRDPSYTCAATSAEGIQDAIWNQRRVEFWGEGMAWYDLLRLKKGVNRLGAGFPAAAVFNLAANDNVLIYAIPQGEEQYNPLIVNNPEVTRPTPIKDEE